MNNLKIALLLHYYQPWWQFPYVLKRIADECYRPILKLVGEKSGFCFSANINYILLQLLEDAAPQDDFRDVIDGFKKAVEEGKIELLGSTAFHPIMPLIPKDLQIAQMIADAELKQDFWGIGRNCDGLFLPEMAFSQSILPNVKNFGYRWTVLDDVPFNAQYGYVPFDHVPGVQNGFRVFLRSNYWSNQVAGGNLNFKTFRDKLGDEFSRWTKNKPAYLIIALDGETFGHHHKGLVDKFLAPMIKEWGSGGSEILTRIEEIGSSFPVKPFVRINDGSWSTSADDYWRDDPFPLWQSKYNQHHQKLWHLVNLALKHYEKPEAKWNCLQITSSCHWWWISRRPWWNPEFMKLGAVKAMELIEKCGSVDDLLRAKPIFDKLNSLR